MEIPPTDDVCPFCFGNFNVPCRASCGHWCCGSCILQYWRFNTAFLPCKCPMCLQSITKLIVQAPLNHRHQAETSNILCEADDYNRLFVGGISRNRMIFLVIAMYAKRIFRELLNPERPGIYINQIRIIGALLAFLLYLFAPDNFLQIGRGNVICILDYSTYVLSFIFYLVGLFLRWRRERNIRELADMPQGHN